MRVVPPASSGVRRRVSRRARGSVLIVALLISALIALVLGSYLSLNLSSARQSRRTFNGYAALNLVEAGVEEAVWSFNRTTAGDTTGWDGWTPNGSARTKKFSGFSYGPNTTGWIKVYVGTIQPPPNVQPKIVAQASIGAPNEAAQTKMLEVTLRRRSYFAGGLVAKNNVAFSGNNASVDSWDSDPDDNASTPAIPYSTGVRTDRGSVASTAIINTAMLINQANIWGTVATGGGQPQVGPNGTIRGSDTPANVAIDPTKISTDFNAEFNVLAAPVDGTPILTVGATLGVVGTKTKWRTPGLTLAGSDTLTILGEVTLVVTAGSGADAISVTGNASIVVPAASSLTIYVEGNVKIAGKSIVNANPQPLSCQLWGTNQTVAGQTIEILGTGSLAAIVYAPNGDVKIAGNGDVMGSIVANNITFMGNAAFHYDESLARRESNAPFGIGKWRELTTAAERAQYDAAFAGW